MQRTNEKKEEEGISTTNMIVNKLNEKNKEIQLKCCRSHASMQCINGKQKEEEISRNVISDCQ